MKKFLLSGIVFAFNLSAFCQISFENQKELINTYQMPSLNSEILAADLNNDGTKDLITTSMNLGLITIHPNIDGDFTATQPKLILENQNEYPTGVSVLDIDNDGMLDILVCNRFENKISWFRNLGNFTFSNMALLVSITGGPNLTVISDVDGDGIKDIVVNRVTDDDNIVWLKNNGNGTFTESPVVMSNSAYSIVKIVLKDLDNNGIPELIVGDNSGYVHWAKNLGNGIFFTKVQLGYCNGGKSFEFVDLNGDNYVDYVSSSSLQLNIQLNQGGTSFGNTQLITNATTTLHELKLKDIDDDGLEDLVGSTGTGISYHKRLTTSSFANTALLFNATPATYFIADQLNNDTHIDFIVPLYNNGNDSNTRKLYSYMGNANVSFTEKLISFYNSAVFTVKIADLDNDGKNDIISSFKSVVWNKNKGNGEFTSYRKISTDFPYVNTFTHEVEAVDIDNDNDKDIVASTQIGIEVYYNDGNGNFTLGYALPLQYPSRNFDVADLNGDMKKDIVMTFKIQGSSGEISLAWIPNLTGTTFGSLTTIGVTAFAYLPYLLVSTDMDNDGDIDIVTYSNEFSRIHFHTNNGDGTFTKTMHQDPISAVCIAVEDYDNDGDKDVFAAGNYYPGVYLIKNNNGVFANKTLIEIKKADAIGFADLNGDGFKELVGTATENSNLGTLFYFLNNGVGGFNNQVIVNSETYFSQIRNIAIGHLNNDTKPDIVNSQYFVGKVFYFLNSSSLSIMDNEITDTIAIYPVPFSDTLHWEIANNSDFELTLYNEEGKLIYSKKGINTPSIDLGFLAKGIYFLNLKSGGQTYTRKIIKN